MNRLVCVFRKFLLVSILLTVCGSIPTAADTDVTETVTVETAVTASESDSLNEEETKNKMLSAVLLLSTVSGAMIIIALIWRGVDKAKYL